MCVHGFLLECVEQVSDECPENKEGYDVEDEKEVFEVRPIFRPWLGISALTESPHANVVAPSSYAFVDVHEPHDEEEVCNEANGRT